VGQYGSGYFASNASVDLVVFTTGNQTISGVKTFATGIFAPNLVYNTGNQMISGTKIFGSSNTIDSEAGGSTILGGNDNTITGDVSNVFIANGSSNVIGDTGRARPSSSYIGNGFRNVISGGGRRSVILNGECNRISSSEHILIGNGLENVITGGSSNYSVLMNGAENSFTDTDYVFLGNGTANCLGLDRTGVSDTSTKATHSSIINGSNNTIVGDYNIIGGGTFNKITGTFTINCSQAYSRSNVIVGGANNSIQNSSCSAILGGRYNEVIHDGATVIGDGSFNVKTSRGMCSLLLYFQNGIYLESPIFDFIGGRPTVNGTEVLLSGQSPAISDSLVTHIRPSGTNNVFVSSTALASTSSFSQNNIAVGVNALTANGDGDDNVAMGHEALYSNTNGNGNIGIGRDALKNANGPDANICIGTQAGDTIQAGGSNIIIGHEADVDDAGRQRCIVLGRSATSPAIDGSLAIGGTAGNAMGNLVSVTSGGTSANKDLIIYLNGVRYLIALKQ
jgi:hypothetical protein